MIEKLTKLFPVWAVLLSAIAYFYPDLFSGFSSLIIPLLTIIMFGMGMTLTWENFGEVIKTPRAILLGFILQFGIMPSAAYLISIIFSLPPELMAGTVLVGCAPGGTASNVITYLAKGNVALSITLTLTSTIFAVILTPSFTYLLLNQVVEVQFWQMLLDILQIVLIPVIVGTAINSFGREKLDKVRNIFPFISTAAIVLIIAIIVALNKSKIADVNFLIIFTVILHNSTGLLLGYFITKLFKYNESICRTIAIEVGMQNSGLAVALAVKYFSASAALPGAIFSVWHNISGSLLAGYWRRKK